VARTGARSGGENALVADRGGGDGDLGCCARPRRVAVELVAAPLDLDVLAAVSGSGGVPAPRRWSPSRWWPAELVAAPLDLDVLASWSPSRW
jgi:hypothetical protein